MTFLTALGAINYGLVLIYGLFLSAHISGGSVSHRQNQLLLLLCPLFLIIQTPCWLILGESTTKQLYPLIVHLPLVLILIFALKKPIGVALVSVCTAYLCCQLPRWVDLAITAVTRSPLAGEISYTLVIFPFFSAAAPLLCTPRLQCHDCLVPVSVAVRQPASSLLFL